MVTEKQKQAVKLFYKSNNVREVAEAIGVHRTTLWRWSKNPEYMRYAKQYYKRADYRLNQRMLKKWNEELDSPDPDVSYERALKIYDLCLKWAFHKS